MNAVFGSLFNNITLIRYVDQEQSAEAQRMIVPIAYGPKEKYFQRLQADPTQQREMQAILPRMSYELIDLNYAPSRKLNTINMDKRVIMGTGNDKTLYKQYMPVPYDYTYKLYIHARNIEDGTQIIEQILPYFTPDFTVTVNLIPTMGYTKDIPIRLEKVEPYIEWEGEMQKMRRIEYTLTFTALGYFFAPITTQGVIKTAIVTLYDNSKNMEGQFTTLVFANSNSFSSFAHTEMVYQGNTVATATATGFVADWSYPTKRMIVSGPQGKFVPNQFVTGVDTGAKYLVESLYYTPQPAVRVTHTTNPAVVFANGNFSIDTTIEDFEMR